MVVARYLLASALIASAAWQLYRYLVGTAFYRARIQGRKPQGHRRPQPDEPGGWRNLWWAGGSIVSAIIWISGPHRYVLLAGLGVLILILIVTIPIWDPAALARQRMRRTTPGPPPT
jgi:hypothetical protein